MIKLKRRASLLIFILVNLIVYGVSSKTLLYSSVLALLVVWQVYGPQFPRPTFSSNRWAKNFTLTFLTSAIAGLPLGAAADYAATNNIGLFNVVTVNEYIVIVCGVLLLDLLFYSLHVISHKIKYLWRCHRVHHSDLDFDVSLVGRDHPIIAVIFAIARCAVILAFGLPLIAIIAYYLAISIFLPFCHSNVKVPNKVESLISPIFVTPRMHYIHHTSNQVNTDTNYGVLFSFWDRLFSTHQKMKDEKLDLLKKGLDEFPNELSLKELIKMPVIKSN